MPDLHDMALEAFAALPLDEMARVLRDYQEPKLPGREDCDLCRKHSSPCIVHRTPDEWGKR